MAGGSRRGASVVFSPFNAPPLVVARVSIDSFFLFVFFVLFFRLLTALKYTNGHRAPFVALPIICLLLLSGELFTIIALRWPPPILTTSGFYGVLIGGTITSLADPLFIGCAMTILYKREKELRRIIGSAPSTIKGVFEWGSVGLFMAVTVAWIGVRSAQLAGFLQGILLRSTMKVPVNDLGWAKLGTLVASALVFMISSARLRSKFEKATVTDPITNSVTLVIAPVYLIRAIGYLVILLLNRFYKPFTTKTLIYNLTADVILGVAYTIIFIALIRLANHPLLWDIDTDSNRGFQPVPPPDNSHLSYMSQNRTTSGGYPAEEWKPTSDTASPLGYNPELDKQEFPSPHPIANQELYGHWRPGSLTGSLTSTPTGQPHAPLPSTIQYSNMRPPHHQHTTSNSHQDWRQTQFSVTSGSQPSVNLAGFGVPPYDERDRERGDRVREKIRPSVPTPAPGSSLSSPGGSYRDFRMSEVSSKDTDRDTLRSYITGSTTKPYVGQGAGPVDLLPKGARR